MKRFLALAMSCVLALGALAGCGGGGSGGDSGEKVIKVGVFECTTGENGGGGQLEVNGIQYANQIKPTVNIGGEEVTCPHAHGEQDIEEAIANSCNGVFGQLAVELGGETMQKYADAAGLTKSIKVDGIQTSVGKFDF